MEELKRTAQRIYDLSLEIDQRKNESDRLRSELLMNMQESGLVRTKFDFGDKIIYCNERSDNEGLTQRLLKNYLSTEYPQINQRQFMSGLLASRSKRQKRTLDIERK